MKALYWLFLPMFLTGLAVGEEPPLPVEHDDLKPIVSDDFQHDSRGEYITSGMVNWESGNLTLMPSASISRTLQAGGRANVRFHVAFPQLTSDGEKCSIHLRFDLERTLNAVVMLYQARQEGHVTGKIMVIGAMEQPDGSERLHKLREHVIDQALPDGEWTIAIHRGLARISSPRQQVYLGFVPADGEAMSKLDIACLHQAVCLQSLSVACESPPPPLSEDLKATSQRARNLNDESVKLFRAGEYPEAIVRAEESLELHKQVFGSQHLVVSTLLNNLSVMASATGQYAKSEKLILEAHEIRRRVLGEDHPQLATSLTNIGQILLNKGKYDEAEKAHLAAHRIYVDVLGKHSEEYPLSLNNLGVLYDKMGKYPLAEERLLESIQGSRAVLPKDHVDLAGRLLNLASLYLRLDRLTDAEPLLLEARGIYGSRLGEEHPDNARVLGALGSLYHRMGEYGKAEELYKRTLAIRKKVLGDTHHDYIESLLELAQLYADEADYGRAEPIYVTALHALESVPGKEHPLYASVSNGLALTYEAMGELAKAEQLFEESLELDKRLLGTEHPSYSIALNNLAMFYDNIGRREEAEKLLLESLAIKQRTLTEDHPDYLQSLSNLGHLYISMKQYSKAEASLQKAIALWQKYGKERDRSCAIAIHNLGRVNSEMGKFDNAEVLYLQARDMLQRILGPHHRDVATPIANLASLYLRSGQFEKARQYGKEAWRIQFDAVQAILPGLSQAESLSYLSSNRPDIGELLSATRERSESSAREMYEYVWKSQNLAWRLLPINEGHSTLNSEAIAVSRQLRQARRQLAQLALTVPTVEKRDDLLTRMAQATNEKEQLERQLAQLSVESADYQRIRDASVGQLAALLPPDAAFVDIVCCADYFTDPQERDEQKWGKLAVDYRYHAFIIRPATAEEEYRVSWVPLDKMISIDEAITAWRKAVSGNRDPGSTTLPDQAMLTDAASTVRRLVWDKIEPQLTGCRVVIITPEGKLSQVAWGALPGSQPDTLLIEEYAIATAAFGQQLYGLLSAPPTSAGKLLVAGGIRYDDPADLKPDSPDSQRSATADPAVTHGSLVTDHKRTVWPCFPAHAWKRRKLSISLAGTRNSLILPSSTLTRRSETLRRSCRSAGMSIWQRTVSSLLPERTACSTSIRTNRVCSVSPRRVTTCAAVARWGGEIHCSSPAWC